MHTPSLNLRYAKPQRKKIFPLDWNKFSDFILPNLMTFIPPPYDRWLVPTGENREGFLYKQLDSTSAYPTETCWVDVFRPFEHIGIRYTFQYAYVRNAVNAKQPNDRLLVRTNVYSADREGTSWLRLTWHLYTLNYLLIWDTDSSIHLAFVTQRFSPSSFTSSCLLSTTGKQRKFWADEYLDKGEKQLRRKTACNPRSGGKTSQKLPIHMNCLKSNGNLFYRQLLGRVSLGVGL